MVRKHDGWWRMCVDFTYFNKFCPKYCYPLPVIDQKVEERVEYTVESLSLGHTGRTTVRMTSRKGKKRVSPSSSERTIEDRPTPSSAMVAEYGPDTNWVARPPLLMVNVPRIATDELASEMTIIEVANCRATFHIPTNVEIRNLIAQFELESK